MPLRSRSKRANASSHIAPSSASSTPPPPPLSSGLRDDDRRALAAERGAQRDRDAPVGALVDRHAARRVGRLAQVELRREVAAERLGLVGRERERARDEPLRVDRDRAQQRGELRAVDVAVAVAVEAAEEEPRALGGRAALEKRERRADLRGERRGASASYPPPPTPREQRASARARGADLGRVDRARAVRVVRVEDRA